MTSNIKSLNISQLGKTKHSGSELGSLGHKSTTLTTELRGLSPEEPKILCIDFKTTYQNRLNFLKKKMTENNNN